MRLTTLVSGLLAILLTGCIQVDDTLTLQPDGSGTIEIRVTTNEERGSSDDDLFRPQPLYPPLRAMEAFRLLPAQRFQTRVAAVPGRKIGLHVQASFPNLASLLDSPYAEIHRLTVRRDRSAIEIAGHAGFEVALACRAELEHQQGVVQMGMKDTIIRSLRWRFRLVCQDLVAEVGYPGSGIRSRQTIDTDTFATALAERAVLRLAAPDLPVPEIRWPALAGMRFDEVHERCEDLPIADATTARAQARLLLRQIESTERIHADGKENVWLSLHGLVALPAGWVAYPQREDPSLRCPDGKSLRGMLAVDSWLDGNDGHRLEDWGDQSWRWRTRWFFSVDDIQAARSALALQAQVVIRPLGRRALFRFPWLIDAMPAPTSGVNDSDWTTLRVARPPDKAGLRVRISQASSSGLLKVRAHGDTDGTLVEDLQCYDADDEPLVQYRTRDDVRMVLGAIRFPISVVLRVRLPSGDCIPLTLEAALPAVVEP